MTPEERQRGEQERMWRNRFILLNLVRIGGTLVVLIGLAIWYSDLLVEGGSIRIGLPLALVGLTISFWGPKRLSQHWRSAPPPGR